MITFLCEISVEHGKRPEKESMASAKVLEFFAHKTHEDERHDRMPAHSTPVLALSAPNLYKHVQVSKHYTFPTAISYFSAHFQCLLIIFSCSHFLC